MASFENNERAKYQGFGKIFQILLECNFKNIIWKNPFFKIISSGDTVR